MVRYSNKLEKRIQGLVLATPVSLHSEDFAIKLPLYKMLKIMKVLKDLRLMPQEINPGELTIIINKAYIVSFASNR
jgi:hypothetical protein